MVMTARVKLGWVTIEELEAQAAAEAAGDADGAEAEGAAG
jgi:N utilization substance protein A